MRRIPIMLGFVASVVMLTSASALAMVVRAAASPPVNSSLPTISGTVQQGQTLTAANGSWSGLTPITYTYQWQRCDSGGSDCRSIASATNQNYVASSRDVSRTIRVAVTATNSDGTAQALSSATGVVAAVGSAPVNTTQPNASGTARQGQTVTVDNGSWSGLAPIAFSYQWQSCTSSGTVCTDLSGATGHSYQIAVGDVGSLLRATVTATNSLGKNSASSSLTAAVVATSVIQTASFNAVLRPNQELTRPRRTSSLAAGRFSAKVSGKTLSWTLTFSHLSGRPTVATLNKGARAATGAAFKSLCRGCYSPVRGTLTLTASQLSALMAGKTYVNIHTLRNLVGEIRGQINRVS
jgi:hypothetical protein